MSSRKKGKNTKEPPGVEAKSLEEKDSTTPIVSKLEFDPTSIDALEQYSLIVRDILEMPEDDLHQLWEEMSYQGYNRDCVMKSVLLRYKLKNSEILAFSAAVALRGPKKAERIIFSSLSNTSMVSKKIVTKSSLTKWDVSPTRLCNAYADLAAWLLKRFKAEKKIQHECPGWLQFPSAASIKMPDAIRRQHKDFCKKFADLIGGEFREDLYDLASENAFLPAEKLALFE